MNPIIKSLVIASTVFLGLIIAAAALSPPPSASSSTPIAAANNSSGSSSNQSSSGGVGGEGVKVTGERYFANGTGIAYFTDGTTRLFRHMITPEKEYFYDNSTIFYAGDIPEVNSTNATSTGRTVNVSINFGGSNLGNKSFDPNPVRIKVGDTVTWTNDDQYSTYTIASPPLQPGILGMNFMSDRLEPGDTFSHTFTKPGGFHYEAAYGMRGTVIVEE
jgi:plastocyanin